MKSKFSIAEDFPPVTRAEWEAIIERDLKGGSYEKRLHFKTNEGITVKPYYRQDDLPAEGVANVPVSSGNWQICEQIIADSPDDLQTQMKEALAGGAEILHLTANPEWIENLPAELLVKPIVLSSEIEALSGLNALIGASLNAEKPEDEIEGLIAFDPMAKLFETGDWDAESAEELLLITPAVPKLKVLVANGIAWQEKGASAVEELAFVLATVSEYLASFKSDEISLVDIVDAIQVQLAIGSNYFMEIAKFRAMRLLWNKLLSVYSPNSDRVEIKIAAVTSRWNKTIYDQYNNILRVTTEAMSAILGGADSVMVLPFDDIVGKPLERSRRIARNIQHILRHESYFDKVEDPAGGSYYIESLTDELCQKVWTEFQEIEAAGGMKTAVEQSIIQQKLDSLKLNREDKIATGKEVLLGTNRYANPDEPIFIDSVVDKKMASTGFDAVRQRTGELVLVKGRVPAVFLMPLGDKVMRRARMMFAQEFVASAGVKINIGTGYDSVQEAENEASESDVIVLCSDDQSYGKWIDQLNQLPNLSAKIIYVAGYPKDSIENFITAGVKDFIHVKSNRLQLLSDMIQAIYDKTA